MKNFVTAFVCGLTVCCGAGAIALALYGPDPLPPDLKQIFDACLSLSVAGMLTWLGIVGRIFPQSKR